MIKDNFVNIPLAGNSFVTVKGTGKDSVSRTGWTPWCNPETVFSIYIKLKKTGELGVILNFKPAEIPCILKCRIEGNENTSSVSAGDISADFGKFNVSEAGYLKIDICGISGGKFPKAESVSVSGTALDEVCGYVKPDDKSNFYWTRRGPSVHCAYDISNISEDVEWFYNEVTVNPGEDPIGTYAMGIGFSGGYFGIQVNSKTERRILFSIWSPYVTDDPSSIPEEKRVVLRTKKPEVYTGEFGGEGSGGQSYLKYNWISGMKYKFLMRIRPVASDRTEFTAYFFFPESGKWELFASFIRPETHLYIEHPHSFLENFDDTRGFLFRKASYTNQWAVTSSADGTASGKWIPVSSMTVTADATARAGNREDYAGGADAEKCGFFLCNGGFFNEFTPIKSVFSIEKHGEKPDINLSELAEI